MVLFCLMEFFSKCIYLWSKLHIQSLSSTKRPTRTTKMLYSEGHTTMLLSTWCFWVCIQTALHILFNLLPPPLPLCSWNNNDIILSDDFGSLMGLSNHCYIKSLFDCLFLCRLYLKISHTNFQHLTLHETSKCTVLYILLL